MIFFLKIDTKVNKNNNFWIFFTVIQKSYLGWKDLMCIKMQKQVRGNSKRLEEKCSPYNLKQKLFML